MARNGHLPQMTWPHFTGAFLLVLALIGTVLKVSGAAETAVTNHNVSDISHPKAEKELDARVNGHNKDRFAHPEMRQMIQEELRPIKEDTAAILVEIRKIKE